jgi:phosphate-selective porin
MHQNTHSSSHAAALFASTAFVSFLPGLAVAQTNHLCTAWNVDRSIEVVTPGDDGALCQVVYRKPDEGVADQTLWSSNRSVAFCEDKAQALATRLSTAGFECGEGELPAQITPVSTVAPVEKPIPVTPPQPQTAASVSPETAQTAPSGGKLYNRSSGVGDTSWHLAGYADTTFIATSAQGETNAEFSSARFNPVFHFQYKDLVLLEAELEVSIDNDGETEVELEYTQADIFLHDNATLVVGKFLSPVGQFQERLHPTWVNRLSNAPAGFGHDGVQPASELGAMLRGGVSVGSTIVTYSVAVGNGPRVSHEGGVSFEAVAGDDNSNKAVSGRIGFLPLPYLEVGASFLVGDVTGVEVTAEENADDHGGAEPPLIDDMGLAPSTANVSLWGADAAYTRGPWDVRAEYLNSTRDAIATAYEGSIGVGLLPKLEMEAWYAQVAYRLSNITDNKTLQKFEPVVRYGEFRITGLDELAEEAAEERFSVGINYWLAPSIVARGVAEWRDFPDRPADASSETRYILQLAYGF